MLPLWQRGGTLSQALAVLHGITEDPDAGRAERHDMIDAFDGLDRYIPRPVRAEPISWQQQGFIAISRIPLTDAPEETDLLAAPDMRWTFRRWGEDSPLRRAAPAGLAHAQGLDVELDDVDLAGQRLPTPRRRAGHRSDPRWWINWKWQGYRSIVYCVTGRDGRLEVVQPTRTRPLNTLVIRPGPDVVYTMARARDQSPRGAGTPDGASGSCRGRGGYADHPARPSGRGAAAARRGRCLIS